MILRGVCVSDRVCVSVRLSTQQLDQLSEQNNTLKMTLKDTEAKVSVCVGGGRGDLYIII